MNSYCHTNLYPPFHFNSQEKQIFLGILVSSLEVSVSWSDANSGHCEISGVSTYFGKRSISFHWFLNASNDDCAIGDDVSRYAGRAVSGLGLPLTTGSLDYGIHTKESKGNVNGAPKLFTENMSNGTLKHWRC